MRDNTINIFSSDKELREHAVKKEYVNCSNPLFSEHYRRQYVRYKGSRDTNDREVYCKPNGMIAFRKNGHQRERLVFDGYTEAIDEIRANQARWLEKYNERHSELMSYQDLRKVSLWMDDNHRGLNGYHNVDTDTKYCPLHLKNEKPYYYQGIELEVTWDDEIVDGYTGDRYDEDGDYDEYGDYDDEGDYIPDKYNFDINSVVRRALEIGKGLFTAEEDGSLYYGYSAEFVSRPLSSQAWHSPQIKAILKEFTDYLKSTGAMVEQPEGNGFHIHVSKKFFEANPNCNRPLNEVARDMNWVFQKFQDEIELIGGREYNEWCASAKMNIKGNIARNYGIVIDKAHIDKKAIELPYGDHRKAFIDSSSGYTYEARVFHSTLDPERILACLEFMRNISHGARENALEGKTFGQITKYKDAPNLQAIIKRIRAEKKKLYLGKKNTSTMAFSTN